MSGYEHENEYERDCNYEYEHELVCEFDSWFSGQRFAALEFFN